MGENFGLFKSFGDRLFEGETPTNLGLIGSAIALDSDVLAFFNRVTAAGGTLSGTEQIAIANLVADLKGIGAWTFLKAIYPMVGSSAAACAQNLKDASFTGTFSSGWTFASTGATPNGTSAFMNTGLNTSTNLTKTAAHLSLYVRNNSNAGIPYDLGNSSDSGMTANPTYLLTRYTNNISYFGIADPNYATTFASLDSRGFWNIATNGSSTQTVYRNGTLWTTGIGTSGNLANNNLYLGAANGNGNPVFFSNKEYAFCTIGDGLTSTQAANLYTSVQTFQTTLSRQV
jgi:hypothetical protein